MGPTETLLLSIVGISPAVVTETLYAIHRDEGHWPDAVKIITTKTGKEKVIAGLLQDGHLKALCAELERPNIPFGLSDILVVPDANGREVEDARSVEDHEALANFIMQTVRDETEHHQRRIHASIAGGRKTMTFYLGYAMSLFGRHFDQLSHVLVSDGYERCHNFFYPTRNSKLVRIGNSDQYLDAKNAEITLADIPFIRQRNLVPALIKQVKSKVNFRQLVNLLNLGDQPEAIQLKVHSREQAIDILDANNGNCLARVSISNPLHWCFYLLLLEDAKQEMVSDRGQYARPKQNTVDTVLTTELLLKLSNVYSLSTKGGDGFSMINNLINGEQLDDSNVLVKGHLSKSLIAIRNGVSASVFSTYCNGIKASLEDQLPKNLASHIIFEPIIAAEQEQDEAGEDNKPQSKRGQGKGYGIKLPCPDKQILII